MTFAGVLAWIAGAWWIAAIGFLLALIIAYHSGLESHRALNRLGQQLCIAIQQSLPVRLAPKI